MGILKSFAIACICVAVVAVVVKHQIGKHVPYNELLPLQPQSVNLVKQTIAYLLIRLGQLREGSFDLQEAELLRPETMGDQKVDTPPGTSFTDNHYFLSYSLHDESAMRFRLGWRPGGVESLVELFLPEIGAIVRTEKDIPLIPVRETHKDYLHTSVHDSDPHEGGRTKGIGGNQQGKLILECIEPTKRWKISYEGIASVENGNVHLKVDLEWTATTQVFNFGRDSSLWGLAKQLAQPAWSRDFFEGLKTSKQTRLEQGGILQGVVEYARIQEGIQGPVTQYQVQAPTVHARTFGPRNYGDYTRWTSHNAMLEDGSFIHLTAVHRQSWPHLIAGYHMSPQGVQPLLHGASLPSMGLQPRSYYEFILNMENALPLKAQVSVDMDRSISYIYGHEDENGSAVLFEGLGTYAFYFPNGTLAVRGRGIAEWGYEESHYQLPLYQ